MKDIENLKEADEKAGDLTNNYLSYLKEKKNRSAMTLDFYRKDLHQFTDFLTDSHSSPASKPPADDRFSLPPELDACIFSLDQQKAQRYVDEFLAPNYSPATVTRKITAIRGLYNYLREIHRIDSDPLANIVIPPQDNSADVQYLEDTQLQQLFDAISGDNWLAFRDRAIVALLYCTGIRVSELLSITLKEIDCDRGIVQIRTSGSVVRQCKLPAWAVDVLRQYLEQRRQQCPASNNQPALFINCDTGPLNARSIRRKLKEYSRRAGLPVEATPATLRHTCAMHMLLRGASVKIVRRILGHMSASSMRPYLKCIDEIQKTSDSMLELVESAIS